MATLRAGAIGVVITLTVKEAGVVVDISTATTKQIKLRKPSGGTATYTGSFVTNGTDGKLTATTTSGDLDDIGTYHASAYLTISGWTDHSSRLTFDTDEAP